MKLMFKRRSNCQVVTCYIDYLLPIHSFTPASLTHPPLFLRPFWGSTAPGFCLPLTWARARIHCAMVHRLHSQYDPVTVSNKTLQPSIAQSETDWAPRWCCVTLNRMTFRQTGYRRRCPAPPVPFWKIWIRFLWIGPVHRALWTANRRSYFFVL